MYLWGTWVAQSVEYPTLDLCSGHDLMVRELEPRIGLCTNSVEPAWDSLSPFLSASLLLSLSFKINKLQKNVLVSTQLFLFLSCSKVEYNSYLKNGDHTDFWM